MNTAYAYNMAVVFCYIVRGDEVLLIRRTAPPEADKYTVPGGRKERGEDLLSACKREVLEETSLVLHDVRFRGVISIAAQGSETETLAFYFLSDDFSGEPVASGEGALEWCGIDESYCKAGISDYYVCISPYVLGEGGCFIGSARIGGGEIESLNIE